MKTLAYITISVFILIFAGSIAFTAYSMDTIIKEQEPRSIKKQPDTIKSMNVQLKSPPNSIQLAKEEQHSNPGQIISPRPESDEN